MHERKSVPLVSVKAVDEAQGIVEFIPGVYGNIDSGGDRVHPGAFSKAFQERLPKFVADHDWTMASKLGKVLSTSETPNGPLIVAQFNLQKQASRDVFSDFLFAPEDQEFSFSYEIAPGGSERKDGVREIYEFSRVFEVGPVVIGMNQETQLLAVKKAKLDELAGSMEELQDELRDAVKGWAADSYPDARLEATFTDRIIVSVVKGTEKTYLSIPYTGSGDTLSLGEPTEVELSAQIVAKFKSGRRNSASDLEMIQQAHDLSTGLGGLCAKYLINSDAVQKIHNLMGELGASHESKAKTEEPDRAKVEELETTIRDLFFAFPHH